MTLQLVSVFFLGLTLSLSSSLEALWLPPHLFPTTNNGGTLDIASDANGHAITALSDGGELKTFYFDGISWSVGPTATFSLTDLLNDEDQLDLSMNASGKALMVWADNSGVGDTAYFNGSFWQTPAGNPFFGMNVRFVAVDLRDSGDGVAVWIDALGNVFSSFFSGGAWSIPITIGIGDLHPSVAYSSNGTAVAGWQSIANGVTVNNFIGGIWQAPVILSSSGTIGNVGIDANGRALAIWENGSILASSFNGTLWLAPQVPEPSFVNSDPSLSMAPGGTAVAVWNSAIGGRSSSYNGSTWSPSIPFTTDNLAVPSSVSVNRSGDALVVFGDVSDFVQSARLPFGALVWEPEETIQPDDQEPLQEVHASLSDNGRGFAAWRNGVDEDTSFFASATALPLPPLSASGETCKTRFATQVERVNIITFVPSLDPLVISYNLRRNGILIATIPASGPYVFFDANRCRNEVDTYSLTSVTINGEESTPVIIVL